MVQILTLSNTDLSVECTSRLHFMVWILTMIGMDLGLDNPLSGTGEGTGA